ncbi:putative cytosol aminopeptidase [Aureimonas endophytica]|uniref:Probable cytosol aminopeptidase n=1 Tax=Aureimonas endophytica TaxID=2027858 RepID=A0A916ZC10_9HYPH|nr:leucyl aminopeptidase [Aureimonas endophytica]GGD85683.1 putative cytosol aminopeptidase [Aureimonas endophytica]
MSERPTVRFSALDVPSSGVLVVLAGENGAVSAALPGTLGETLARAASKAKFKGKSLSTLELIAPAGTDLDKILLVGTKADKALGAEDWLKLGGTIAAKAKGASAVTVLCAAEGIEISAAEVAALGAGIQLRAYAFDRYKSKKGKAAGEGEEEAEVSAAFTLGVADQGAAEAAFAAMSEIVSGVTLARDLVNEPANVLGPVEFAERIATLSAQGVDVEILDEKKMAELKMQALLGVAQGSPRPPRFVIMRWNGRPDDEAPVAFIGKGVVFDTGGVSIKPAAGMEDMKGDMGGAAAVVGLMRALAGRKAKVNAIGIVGLVENAVDGNAQRPGDIVTAMSGTTIEVLNTDAEGRLVLADALWYCQDRFKPKFMVNLATLTGAIIVALGHHHAGLFSNNDELADRLLSAGLETGEKVWRMPLGPEYDKQIEGKFADIKNIGNGRSAGSITAAQFLQRFVNDVPWAHLDVAGTAMGSPSNEYSQSWASGYGVRLLDRLVAAHYETP